jgi:hypothetical protein
MNINVGGLDDISSKGSRRASKQGGDDDIKAVVKAHLNDNQLPIGTPNEEAKAPPTDASPPKAKKKVNFEEPSKDDEERPKPEEQSKMDKTNETGSELKPEPKSDE